MEKNIDNLDVFETLKKLSKIGKVFKEVEIEGIKILLGTLNSEQEEKVFIACSELVGSAYFSRLKRETLKYAIKSVNDISLNEYENLKDPEQSEKLKKETLEKLEKVLGSWDEEVITFLYHKWNEISKQSEEEFEKIGINNV